MSERFILNETSYFGRGSRVEKEREIKERGYKNIMENIESWVLNFKEWADQKHTKYTKQSMKVFFEEMNIEVTELVLDEIKGRIGRFH